MVNCWDVFEFFSWQVVEVFVYWIVWIDVVFDIVKICYYECGEGQVRVVGWIGEVCFEMFVIW